MNMREIQDIQVMKNWMLSYMNDYSGELKSIDHNMLYGHNVRFFVASVNDVDVGFIRINNKSHFFKEDGLRNIWNLADGFVLGEFRGKGILRKIINYAVEKRNVRMLLIETWRLACYRSYYTSLGFDYDYCVRDGSLSWAIHKSISAGIRKKNEKGRVGELRIRTELQIINERE